MDINKERFIKDYKILCKKYNIMLEPDCMAALLFIKFNEEYFDETFNETCRIENNKEIKYEF